MMVSMLSSLFFMGIVMAPPAKPPPGRPFVGNGRGDDWTLAQIDFVTAAGILETFSSSYENTDEKCDFDTRFLKETNLPQGILGLKHKSNMRLLCHFVEENDKFFITTIAQPFQEFEAGKHLFDYIKYTDALIIHKDYIKLQPKWNIAAQYYLTDW